MGSGCSAVPPQPHRGLAIHREEEEEESRAGSQSQPYLCSNFSCWLFLSSVPMFRARWIFCGERDRSELGGDGLEVNRPGMVWRVM